MRGRKALLLSAAASRSSSRSAGRSPSARGCCCSTSPSRASPPRCRSACPRSSPASRARDLAVLITQSELNHSRTLFDHEYVIERGVAAKSAPPPESGRAGVRPGPPRRLPAQGAARLGRRDAARPHHRRAVEPDLLRHLRQPPPRAAQAAAGRGAALGPRRRPRVPGHARARRRPTCRCRRRCSSTPSATSSARPSTSWSASRAASSTTTPCRASAPRSGGPCTSPWPRPWRSCTRPIGPASALPITAGPAPTSPARSGAGPSSGSCARTREIPEIDRLIEWLPAHMAPDDETTICHGDFRLGNLMFHPTEPRVVAVLDWELSTLGHPLADAAFSCIGWHSRPEWYGGVLGPRPRRRSASRRRPSTLSATTGRRAGRAASTTFHLVFSLFRFAVILEGIAARAKAGNAAAENAAQVGRPVRRLRPPRRRADRHRRRR